MKAGGGRTVEGIWKEAEPASEGRSLLKLAALLERGLEMSPASLRERWCCSIVGGGMGGRNGCAQLGEVRARQGAES